MLASFLGVLPILTPPLCALAFIVCSKSNPLVVFALDLMSTYEGEHTISGLWGPANLTQNDVEHVCNSGTTLQNSGKERKEKRTINSKQYGHT
jgi:hypothetical protein